VPDVPSEVAPGVHRLGSPLVNFHLVEEAGRFTLVDAGLPAYFDQVLAFLQARGADIHDVDAVVLTHAHPDQIGIAERMRTEAQAKVYVPGADAQVARTGNASQSEGSVLRSLWRPTTMRFVTHLARNGAGRIPRLEDVTTYADGAELDVPGQITVIRTPGHSHGHSSLLLADRGILFAGDALTTRNPLTGSLGPQLMPRALNASTELALASLDRLEPIEASVTLFGHGEPWTSTPAEAVARAREVAGAVEPS
jgi:glyoxylase-like metal-dependent hydrolase (beta-lactamase superfamily II)